MTPDGAGVPAVPQFVAAAARRPRLPFVSGNSGNWGGGAMPKSGSEVRWQRLRNLLLVAGGLVLAAAVRYPLLSHESLDFALFLQHWYDFIRANGHFAALQYDFSNYNPPYLYLLTLAALAAPALAKLLVIKAVSIAFDFSLAWFVFRVVGLKYRESRTVPILAGLSALLFPTVVLNSALWGQADSIYTTFLVASLYCVLRRRPRRAFAAWGLAFSLKAQAVFLLPLFWWLSRRKRITLRAGWPAPAAYLAALLPAWFLGRPFYELLLVYFAQAADGPVLVRQAPNLYQWLPEGWFPLWPLGVGLTLAVVVAIGALIRRSRAEITNETVVTLAAFSVLLVPFLLPKMHDRYFFPADLFTLALAFWRPRFLAVPFVVGACSLGVYLATLFEWESVPVPVLAAALLLVLGALGRRLLLDLDLALDRERAAAWSRRQWRKRRAGLLPAGALVLALAAVFALFGERGRFARPLAGDPATALTLARVENRGSETAFVGFTRRTVTGSGAESGAVSYELDRRLPFGGDLLLRALGERAASGLSARLEDARGLMALFFLGAALFAYLALRRLFWNPWVALPATLLAFSPFAAGRFDTVAAEAAPAAFSVCLVFYGLVAFHRGGALRRLLLCLGAALSLSFQAYPLLAGFLLFALVPEVWARRRRPRRGGAPPAAAPGRPGLSAAGRRNLAAGAFALLVGAGWVGLRAANEAAFSTGDLRGTAAASPLLRASTAGESESGVPVGAGMLPADPSTGERRFHRLWLLFAPYLPFGEAAAAGGSPLAPAVGLLLSGLALVGGALSKQRALLLPLALTGLLSALGSPAGGGGAIALPLSLFALGAARLDRAGRGLPGGGRRLRILSVGALALFLGSGSRAARVPASGKEAAAVEVRVREDFDRIRRALARRPPGLVVHAPAAPGSGRPDAAALAWYLAGSPIVETEERRGRAEFVLAAGRGRSMPTRGLLTPGNREIFLYHRAAYDREVDALIAAAGAPVIRSRFDVHLHEDRLLLYVREGCRPEDREGTFVLHLLPADPADLPPVRKIYGFDNLSFRFRDRAWELEDRCVAGVPLPDYPFRRLTTGRFFRRGLGDYLRDWRAEYIRPGTVERARAEGAVRNEALERPAAGPDRRGRPSSAPPPPTNRAPGSGSPPPPPDEPGGSEGGLPEDRSLRVRHSPSAPRTPTRPSSDTPPLRQGRLGGPVADRKATPPVH